MNKIGDVINNMREYYSGNIRRIHHFLKIYGFAQSIDEIEDLA